MSGRRIGLVEAEWLRFAEITMPPTVSKIQRQEMRRAFYAGAGLLLERMTNAVGPAEISEDQGMDIMQRVHDEITAFMRDVQRGRR